MAPHSSTRRAVPTIPPIGWETPAQKVYRYTKELVIARNRHTIQQAFLRLSQLDCPLKVFEDCKTEQVIVENYRNKNKNMYQVNIMDRKFKRLRRIADVKKRQEEEEYDPEFPEYEVKEHQPSLLMHYYPVYRPTMIRHRK